MKTTIQSFTAADWGPSLRSAATTLAAVCVAVYTAGLVTGEFVHSVNAQLSSFISSRVATVAPAAPAPVESGIDDVDDAYQSAAALEAHRRSGEPSIPLDQLVSDLGLDGIAESIPQMVIQRQALQPIATIAAPDLSTLTVVQLRQMARAAGHKGLARSGRRADLLQALA